jgi:urea transport system ATP-binding protein
MVLAQDPELLLIDEPVAGMTPKESERTGDLLLALARKHTLIVIDHDMNFVRQIARRVTVLHEGQLLTQGTVGEVQRNPKVIEVYLGQDREAGCRS